MINEYENELESNLLSEKQKKSSNDKLYSLSLLFFYVKARIQAWLAAKNIRKPKKKIKVKRRKHHFLFEELLLDEEAYNYDFSNEPNTLLKHYELYKHPIHLLAAEEGLIMSQKKQIRLTAR